MSSASLFLARLNGRGRLVQAGKDRRTIATSNGVGEMADGRMSYGARGLGWLVRLFLVLFIILVAYIWTDLLMETETYDRLFGSEYACYLSKYYCSWRDYTLSLVPHSLLATAAAVSLSWRRLHRREAILNALAVMVLLFLVWEFVQARSIGYAD